MLEYLQAHPQAAETVEGISAWWLGTSRRGPRVAAVVEALEALVARGTVTCETTPAGETLYRLRRPAELMQSAQLALRISLPITRT